MTGHEGLLARIEAELSKWWHMIAKDYEELVFAQYTHEGVSKAARRIKREAHIALPARATQPRPHDDHAPEAIEPGGDHGRSNHGR